MRKIPWNEIYNGIDEFNQREFFQCHETLEKIWMKYRGGEREFVQGIIQIAVGYYHYDRGNRAGALKLLKVGLDKLRLYGPSCLKIDVAKLIKAVEANIGELASPGTMKSNTFKVPQIEFIAD